MRLIRTTGQQWALLETCFSSRYQRRVSAGFMFVLRPSVRPFLFLTPYKHNDQQKFAITRADLREQVREI